VGCDLAGCDVLALNGPPSADAPMYTPKRIEVSALATRHGLTRRVARLILRINGPSPKLCDDAAVAFLLAAALSHRR
jgi:hypothetical protein